MNKTLSVIIPVYNTEQYVERCINSICNQSYQNLEIIVIDDGSSDSSLLICQKIAEKDPRIRIITKENSGVSETRNVGLDYATGEYVTFVDSDDYIDVKTYEECLNSIGDCDALFYGFRESYEEAKQFKNVSPSFIGTADIDTALYECFLPLGYHVSVCNKVFKMEYTEKIRFDSDLKIGEDELWLIRVVKQMKKIAMINDPLYTYIQRTGSTMNSEYVIDDKWRSALEAKKRVISELSEYSKSYKLGKAKIYNDDVHLVWYAYVSGNIYETKRMKKELKPYKFDFVFAPEYSLKRKIKFFMIDFLTAIKCPKKYVKKLGETTTYKMNVFYKQGIRL